MTPPSIPTWHAIHTHPRKEAAVVEALRELNVDEVFLPLFLPRTKRKSETRGRLLFTRYVFFRQGDLSPCFLETLRRVEGVSKLLGATSGEETPSGIEDGEIEILRALCAGRVFPELVPLPERGARVRIRSGPFAGATGLVLRSGPTTTVLAFSLPILAGAYELRIPTLDLTPLGVAEATTSLPRKGERRKKTTAHEASKHAAATDERARPKATQESEGEKATREEAGNETGEFKPRHRGGKRMRRRKRTG